MDRHDLIQKELTDLRTEVHQQGIRLVLAEAWLRLYGKAYDALLHYGVNFKSLKTWKRRPVDAYKLPLSQARNVLIDFMKRVENDIAAAIRRKQFKIHDNPDG